MKKIFVFSIIAVVVILFLTTSVLRLIFGPDGQIPDENGESKELCHFSDEDIEACYADYRIIGRSVQSKGMGDSHVKGRLEEFDCSYSCTSFGKFSGIYILNAYLADGESVAYTIDSEVLEGNLRIVITDEENQILYDVPIDQKVTLSVETEKNATYCVKLVGESAKVKLELFRD